MKLLSLLFITNSASAQCQSTVAAQLRMLGAGVASGGLFTSVGLGGNLGNLGVTRTCCERNRDNIRRLEKRLDFVENDMGDRFKDNFD